MLTGNKTVTITLLPDPEYTVDPKNDSKTITIYDGDMPEVQFSLPMTVASESTPGAM